MLVHADNFSHYGTNTSLMTSGIYAKVGTSVDSGAIPSLSNDPDGSAGKVLQMTATYGGLSNYQLCRYALPAGATTTVGACFRLWCSALPSVALNIRPIQYLDGGTGKLFYLNVTSTGKLEIRNGADTLLYSTTAPVITAMGWWHIAIQTTISATTGSFEVRVEDVPVISQTGINTGTTSIQQVEIVNDPDGSSFGTTYYVKDFVIWDGTGSSNTTFPGSVLVYELTTTSDVSFLWTSTAANGYSVLDNNPPTTTDYISAPYPAMPAAATFGLSNLPADITSVKGLITIARAAKSDGGDGQLQVSLVSGSSTDNGTNRPITTSQTYFTDVSELDPATGVAWTPTAVNSAILKLDRTL